MTDRYPHRAEALALLGGTLHPRARATLLSRVLSSGDDPPVEHWLESAQTLHWRAVALDSTWPGPLEQEVWVTPDSEPVSTVRAADVEPPTTPYGGSEVEAAEREKGRGR